MKYKCQSYGFNKMIIFICLISLVLCTVSFGLSGCGGEDEISDAEASDYGIGTAYELQRDGIRHVKFINKVDGYRLRIPAGTAVDMSLPSVRAVLENDTERVEIYKQKFDLDAGVTAESYKHYSNLFLENDVNHQVEFTDEITFKGYQVSILQWSREPLKYITDDKCHYASLEVSVSDNESYTFLFKSSKAYGKGQGTKPYLDLLKSFYLQDETAEPADRKLLAVSNPSWNDETAAAYEQYFGEDAKLTWGIFDKEAPVDFAKLLDTERRLDYTFPVLLYYTGFIEGVDKHPRMEGAMKNASEHGRMLELTLQPLSQEDHKGNMVYDVLNGKYDVYLKNYVASVKAYGEPVLFRVGNEMNGDWCVYSAYHTSKDTEIYKAFYRYIHDLFAKSGADNVIWVWNPNAKSFPDFKWNDAFCYYPGDDYVDVVGMTNYNTGTYYEGESWEEFSELYDQFYEEYKAISDKPLMITEFASSSVGGDKAKWVSDMFQHIKKYKDLKMVIWWSSCDLDVKGNISRPYFIDETEEIEGVFRENLAEYK